MDKGEPILPHCLTLLSLDDLLLGYKHVSRVMYCINYFQTEHGRKSSDQSETFNGNFRPTAFDSLMLKFSVKCFGP